LFNPIRVLRSKIEEGHAAAAVLAPRKEVHNYVVDRKNAMTERQYQDKMRSMSSDKIAAVFAEYWDDPAQVELFNRLRFSLGPNATSLEELER